MTPKQYRSAIDRVGLSQVGAARFFGSQHAHRPAMGRRWPPARRRRLSAPHVALDLSAKRPPNSSRCAAAKPQITDFTDRLTVCFTLYRETKRVKQMKQTAPAFDAHAAARAFPSFWRSWRITRRPFVSRAQAPPPPLRVLPVPAKFRTRGRANRHLELNQ